MYQTTIGAHHHRSGRGTEKIHLSAGVEPVPALFQRAGYFTCNGGYKDAKPTVIRLRELHAQGKLSLPQEELLFSPSRPAEELYDLQSDPFETRNLAGNPQFRSTLEALRKRLDRWMVETRDPGPESEKAYDASFAYELRTAKSRERSDPMIKNYELMKQWAKEGK
jgi:hypothetical protein